jgi:uncharacterized protein YbjT (DUF2867 family)
MSNQSQIILAVGAAGKFAGLVVPALAARGARVRAFVRHASEEDEARAHGAVETVIGDLSNVVEVDAALNGVGSVFYIAPAFLPDETNVGMAMVAAAQRANVKRFVFSSVIHPVLSKLVNHAAKAPVEEAVLNSSLEYTFLHPTLFFQNYNTAWAHVIESGVLAEPWSGETRFSHVDYRDVAEVAAIALTEDRLLHGTFELCAEGKLNRADVAALLSRVLRRTIKAERTDVNALGTISAPMKAMFDHYDHVGIVGSPLTLRAILGREPRSLQSYFEELAAAPAIQEAA